jgi:DNA repair protein RadC
MVVNSSAKAHQLIKKRISAQVEEVWVLALSSRLEIIDLQLLFRGTVNFCLLHPRDIFRFLCLSNASAWILIHNHPSGYASPSRQDNQMTRKLWKLSELMEIPLHDHLIVAGENFYSYADHGILMKLEKKTIVPDLKDDGNHNNPLATASRSV